MDQHIHDFSHKFGYEPHRLIENGDFKKRYLMVLESDIRKEIKIRPELISTWHDEYLFVLTEAQLHKLYDYWEAEFPSEFAEDLPDDIIAPDETEGIW